MWTEGNKRTEEKVLLLWRASWKGSAKLSRRAGYAKCANRYEVCAEQRKELGPLKCYGLNILNFE